MNSQEVAPEKAKSAKKAEDDSGFPPIPLFDPSTHTKPTKREALTRADGLADGFILLGLNGSGVEEGWHWVLNGKDEPTIRERIPSHVDRSLQQITTWISCTNSQKPSLKALSPISSTITADGSNYPSPHPKTSPKQMQAKIKPKKRRRPRRANHHGGKRERVPMPKRGEKQGGKLEKREFWLKIWIRRRRRN